MEKYRNEVGTFLYRGTWVSLNSTARKIGESEGNVTIGLTNKEGSIDIPAAIFGKYFVPAGEATDDDLFEFDSRNNKLKRRDIVELIRTTMPRSSHEVFEAAVKKAYQDAFTSAGSTKAITADKYEAFLLGQAGARGLSNFGDPVFNRAARWTAIADEALWKLQGNPAPVGIRPSDFARLRECNHIYRELLAQIFSMDHEFEVSTPVRDYIGLPIEPRSHRCAYCGESLRLSSFMEQDYALKEHPVNFCHRDPSESHQRTRPGNVYFGHTKCNRIQGGLSELERIRDGLRLLLLHRTQYISDSQVRASLAELTN